MRGLAFEYRAKRDDDAWRARWDLAIIVGSFVPALLWGVAFANILRGVPIDADLEYVGGFFNLLNPYALLGGVTTLLLFLTHGAMFVALKTDGEIRHRAAGAGGAGRRSAPRSSRWRSWSGPRSRPAPWARRSRSSCRRCRSGGRAAAIAGRPRGLGLPRHLRRDRARRWPGSSSRSSPT